MKRCISLALLAGLFVWTGAVLAQDAVTIKMKERGEGEPVIVDKNETTVFKMKIVDGDGKVLMEKNETSKTVSSYKETILKLDGKDKKTPAKVERVYSKAEVKKGDNTQDLGLAGKTVLIEKNGDKYTFTFKDGKELEGDAATALAADFNKSKSDNKEIEKAMMPKGPVKPGDDWKLEMGPVIKAFSSAGEIDADVEKSTGTGKLSKTYKKDGKLFGEMQYKLMIPIKAVGAGDMKLKFGDGAKMGMDLNLDVCIDATADVGVMKMKMEMSGTATIPQLPGGSIMMTISGDSTQTQKEPDKK